ncbi:MAG TPA: hypothetical protein VLM89_01485 [Phycisphaerae bacterium]|nr:hypothetical protein [Phycisphaerae bacterium]
MGLTAPFPEHASKRRTRRRWVLRLGAGLIAVLAIAYGSLPLWLPTDWLLRRLVNQLSADLNRPVKIERVRLGWVDGVIFEGITIGDRAGSPEPVLATVSRLRCDFDPLTTLLTGRVHEIEIHEPTLFLAADENGRLNVSDLGRKEGGRLPARNFRVQGLLCHIRTPGAGGNVRFDRLQCSLDPSTGRLRFAGEVRPQRDFRAARTSTERQLWIDAEIMVPRLNPSVSLGGMIRIEWAGLALADLPLSLVPRIPFEQVDGTSTGSVQVDTQPDLHLDFDMRVRLEGVRVRWAGADRQSQVPDARVRAVGHWDPTSEVVVLQEVAYETPGLSLSGQKTPAGRPALRLDLQGAPPMEAHVQGRVKDWRLLAGELPPLDHALRQAGASLEGATTFRLDLDHEARGDQVSLSLDASESACRLRRENADQLRLEAQVPKRLQASWALTRRDGLRIQPRVAAVLGGLTVEGEVELALPDPLPEEPVDLVRALVDEVISSLRANWTARCADFQQVVAMFPVMARYEELRDWRGPLEIKVACTPSGLENQVRLTLVKEQAGAVRFRDLFEAGPGQPLTVGIGCNLPPSTVGRLAHPVLSVSYGPGRLQLDSEAAEIDYRFDFSGGGDGRGGPPISIDARWRLPFQVTAVEQIGALWPGWNELFGGHGRGLLKGNGGFVVSGRLAQRPGDRLVQCAAAVRADDLTIRWEDLLDKPPAKALSAEVDWRLEEVGGRQDRRWMASVRRPGGGATATLWQCRGGQSGEDLERLHLVADVANIIEWLDVSPRLRQMSANCRPSGGFSLDLDSLLVGGVQDVHIMLDASKAGFELPLMPPLVKMPGIEARVLGHLTGRAVKEPDGTMLWQCSRGKAHWAGLHLSGVTGTITTATGTSQPAVISVDRIGRGLWPRFMNARLEVSGAFDFDAQWPDMHPLPRRWWEQYQLGGRAILRLAVDVENHRLGMSGRLDGEQAAFTVPLGGELVERLQKPAGMPTSVVFDLSVEEKTAGQRSVDIGCLTIDIDGNEADLSGHVDLRASGTAAEAERFDLATQVRVSHPESLTKLLAAAEIARLQGTCDLSLAVAGSPGDWSVTSAQAGFENFTGIIGGDNIKLDGQIVFNRPLLKLDGFGWAFGASEGNVSGEIELLDDSHIGRVGLVFQRLDLPDLSTRLDRWAERNASRDAASGGEAVQAIPGILRRCELDIDAHAEIFRATLPGNQALQADAGYAKILIQKGQVTIQFRSLVDGGLATGGFLSHTQVSDPTYHLTYTADSILPGPLVDGYLRLLFPGMTATGPLTLIDETYQKLLPKPGEDNYEVGQGELIIYGGSIEGRAAPLWVTRIFPGLNLARFDFSYLHSWFKKMPNGHVHHQMIYQGQYYNLYMIGYSDATRWFQYEVGLDFLANFDSRYWAESGQGRIPLFVKTGRIDDRGRLIEEQVDFVSYDRVMSTLFVRNNPVVTAYYAVRQRVLAGQANQNVPRSEETAP